MIFQDTTFCYLLISVEQSNKRIDWRNTLEFALSGDFLYQSLYHDIFGSIGVDIGRDSWCV